MYTTKTGKRMKATIEKFSQALAGGRLLTEDSLGSFRKKNALAAQSKAEEALELCVRSIRRGDASLVEDLQGAVEGSNEAARLLELAGISNENLKRSVTVLVEEIQIHGIADHDDAVAELGTRLSLVVAADDSFKPEG